MKEWKPLLAALVRFAHISLVEGVVAVSAFVST